MNDIFATVNLTELCNQAHNLLKELKIVTVFEVVTVNDKGETITRQQHEATRQIELIQNVILEMVSIPDGKFDMGTPKEETSSDKKKHEMLEAEKPQLYMSKYPITQAQWKMVMGENPSEVEGKELPVTNVSWNKVQKFCKTLSELTGKIYRLPSEAEWEYACRANTTTKFHFGDQLPKDKANYDRNHGEKTTPVGSYPPNAFGLYDMHGNVCEWCQDKWHESYQNAPPDSEAWEKGSSKKRVIRGGSWKRDKKDCCSAWRTSVKPDNGFDDLGFRVVRAID